MGTLLIDLTFYSYMTKPKPANTSISIFYFQIIVLLYSFKGAEQKQAAS